MNQFYNQLMKIIAFPQLIHHHPMNPEVLKRSEAVALQIAVANGHSTPAALLQQFAHGALQTKQRETLLMVLKVTSEQLLMMEQPPSSPFCKQFQVMQTTNRLPTMMTPELNQAVNMVAAAHSAAGAMHHSARPNHQVRRLQLMMFSEPIEDLS